MTKNKNCLRVKEIINICFLKKNTKKDKNDKKTQNFIWLTSKNKYKKY